MYLSEEALSTVMNFFYEEYFSKNMWNLPVESRKKFGD